MQYSQNITNTLGNSGLFKIKDGTTDFLSLNQSTGYLSLNHSMILPNTSNPSIGVIYKAADRFLHNYGTNNTFLGINSGNFTMSGGANTGVGYQSLLANTTGYYNTAVGNYSLISNTSGYANTALGNYSLYSNTGNYNTAVGYLALNIYPFMITGNNNTAIGYNAQVPGSATSNQVRIGNTSVTYAGVQVPWTITSDRRWKSDIQSSNLGLSFISKLRPVSYFRLPDGKAGNNDEKQKTEYGFIAQEVEEVLKGSGVENSGMLTISDEGMYELRYNDLLAPMVKSIQELKSENDDLKNRNESLETRLAKYEQMQNSLVKKMEELESKTSEVKEVKLGEK